MLGFSIFLNDEWAQEKEDYVEKMAGIGFEGVFSSLHIPEDDPSKYSERLKSLLDVVKKSQLKLMIDISGNALKNIGLSLDYPQQIVESGISGLRMDYGVEMKTIANLSNYITVGLNASTLTEDDYAELAKNQADFEHIQALHNYYPRPNTGLDEMWFLKKNRWLKSKKMRIGAFVPGDGKLRLPLFETLPTLEIHRYQNPLFSSLSLLRDFMVDDVYIGDLGITNQTFDQFFEYLCHQTILLHAASINEKYDSYIYNDHQNRKDVSRDVVRSEKSRMFNQTQDIQPDNTVIRKRGSITIDNNRYPRYKGELHLVKDELPSDEKVNVIGEIAEKDVPLLHYIEAGTKFKIDRI
ncbi:MupG family TIM beta-alpha barrel fold protein [Neobacillus sp. PS3-12]|uniref:MupG family TIM beta-alpha barrel fold protein n=1 Tax=Neobacillus sp. PS3-12 TaxID=3070677 RepID=UPI0027E10B83|nr:MupG family TIM beta-alpha barrel fold protein [Neobacillus sp. PS3-12]WML51410.1 MupG family TIM beta-alpha barrel fold protein [Neobacillus sp. PS3-12]